MKNKRTYSDRAEYIIKAVSKRRKKLKQMSIEYKGGKCNVCGYNKCVDALEFHHLEEKQFGLSKNGLTRSWDKLKQNLINVFSVC